MWDLKQSVRCNIHGREPIANAWDSGVRFMKYILYLSNNFINPSKANTYWLYFYASMCKNQSTFEKHSKIKYVQKHDNNNNIIITHTRVKMTKYKVLSLHSNV